MGSILKLPPQFNDARKALATLTTFIQVTGAREQAIKMETLAYVAKDAELMGESVTFRKWSERRIGEMMAELRESGKLAKGMAGKAGPGRGKRGLLTNPRFDKEPSLSDQGVDKNLADRSRKAYGMPLPMFEAEVQKAKELALQIITNENGIVRAARANAVKTKLAKRAQRHKDIKAAAVLESIDTRRKFPLIYADPPWRFATYTPSGGMRSPDEHYPTLPDDEIINFTIGERPMSEVAHKDAALFLWCTSSNIELALRVMAGWGFTFKASAVWVKDKQGMGLIFRNWHEVLLYGSRGEMPGPLYVPPSVFQYPRQEHSAKPPEVRSEIEKMYPMFTNTTRLEVFARGEINGWTAFGLESNNAKPRAA